MHLLRGRASLVLFVLPLVAALWAGVPPAGVQAAGDGLHGDLPATGAALLVWDGGAPADLVAAAAARGCTASSVWVAFDGALLVYIDGAPDLVNEALGAHLDGGALVPNTAVVVICGAQGQLSGSGGPGSVAPHEPPSSTAGSSIEQQFAATTFDDINQARAAEGLPPLVAASTLGQAAEQYAHLLMSGGGTLDHFRDGAPWDRAGRAGYPSTVVGEVLASAANSEPLDVSRDSAVLLGTWLNSPPHRDILMGKDFAFADLGVGCAVGHDAGGLNLVLCVAMTGQP